MRKPVGKAILSAATVLLGAVFLGGCGKEKPADMTGPDSEKIVQTEREQEGQTEGTGNGSALEYQASFMQLQGRYDLAELTGEAIYAVKFDESTSGWTFHVLSRETGDVTESVPLDLDRDEFYVNDMATGTDKTVYLLCCYLNNSDTVKLLSKKAGETAFREQEIQFQDLHTEMSVTYKKIMPGSAGDLYLAVEAGVPLAEAGLSDSLLSQYEYIDKSFCTVNRIYRLDSGMGISLCGQVASLQGVQLEDVCFSEKNGLTALVSDSEGLEVRKLDGDSSGSDEGSKIWEGWFGTADFMLSDSNGFLFSCNGTLYRYGSEKGSPERILGWSEWGVEPEGILCINVNGETIETIGNVKNGNCSEACFLAKGESEKTELTLGAMQISEGLREAITSYNRYSDSYRIKTVSYWEDESQDFDSALNRLNLDMVTGKGPDIMETSLINRSVYGDRDVLADLNTFMENDRDVNQDTMTKGVWEACQVNGHLYSIGSAVQIYTVIGKKSVLGDKKGLSLAGYRELLTAAGKDLNAVNGFYEDEPVLTALCSFSMDSFIDWENGTCNFRNPQFRDTMTFAKLYRGGYTGSSQSAGIRDSDILMTAGILRDVADYQILRELFGEELTFVGYPVENGSGTAVGFSNEQLAITQYSENKNGAWDFIKYYLLSGNSGEGFPVIQSAFDEKMKAEQEAQFMTAEDGTVAEMPSKTYSDQDAYIEVYAASEEDCGIIRELLIQADTFYEYNTDIMNIINEEAQAFFGGIKTLEEVTETIQNRVELYLKE